MLPCLTNFVSTPTEANRGVRPTDVIATTFGRQAVNIASKLAWSMASTPCEESLCIHCYCTFDVINGQCGRSKAVTRIWSCTKLSWILIKKVSHICEQMTVEHSYTMCVW